VISNVSGTGELYVVLELCERGSLIAYLKTHRTRFVDEVVSVDDVQAMIASQQETHNYENTGYEPPDVNLSETVFKAQVHTTGRPRHTQTVTVRPHVDAGDGGQSTGRRRASHQRSTQLRLPSFKWHAILSV
jgi:hypothetical protein